MAVLVVGGALLRIGEHLAGFLRLLEALLGFPVVRVAIGMKLHREATVGLLDLRLGRGLRDIQYLVVISLRHACPERSSTRQSRRSPRS